MSFSKQSIWLCLVLSSWFVFGDVKVLVLDTPVNRHHVYLKDVYDTEAMTRYSMPQIDGQFMSMLQINDEAYSNIVSALPKKTPHYLDLLDKTCKNDDPMEAIGAALRLLFKLTNPFSKFNENLLGNYTHGTHVSGIIAQSVGQKGLHLLSFPLIGGRVSDGHHLDIEGVKKILASWISQQEKVVKALIGFIYNENIRVVNLSISVPKSLSKKLREIANFRTRYSHKKELDELLVSHLKQNAILIQSIALSCPETLFVFAAGNDSIDLDKNLDENLLASSKLPNTIFVANISKQDELANSSNYGRHRVTIGAPGESILNARAGGGSIHFSGTSMAAPFVTGKLARIFLDHPTYTAAQALEELYRRAEQRVCLADQISGGRVIY